MTDRAIESWDRRLKVMDGPVQLGRDVVLDMLDLTVWNEKRLPKFILLRQIIWGDGEVGDEFHMEAMQMGTVMPVLSMKRVAREIAENDSRNRYTLVELGWYEREPEPYLQDVCIFDGEGNYTDTSQRDRARRAAARALSEVAS